MSLNMEFDVSLDAKGLMCPEPVMLLHEKIADAEAGAVIRIVATDPSTTRDIPQFCRFLGHELLAQSEDGDTYIYFLRKS
jgi:tRNA 2-thiouridine synthesizing protein A